MTVDVPVIASGAAPRDVALYVTPSKSSFIYGESVQITVAAEARLHDGTRPSGSVALFDETGKKLDEQQLTSEGTTQFLLQNLTSGARTFTVSYAGDAHFRALAGAPVSFTITGDATTTALHVAPIACSGEESEVAVVVTSAGTAVPQGSVRLYVDGVEVATQPLQAGDGPRAFASFRRTFSASATLDAVYEPSGAFGRSEDSAAVTPRTCAPMNVVATAHNSHSAVVQWAPVAGAASYAVLLRESTSWVTATTTTGTSVTVPNLQPERPYLFTVEARNSGGTAIAYGRPDLAVTTMFADDPLLVRNTVRAVHYQQVRALALYMQRFTGANAVFLGAPAAGTPVRAADLTTLRAQINWYRRWIGMPQFSFTDPVLLRMPIRAVHMQELRNAMK